MNTRMQAHWPHTNWRVAASALVMLLAVIVMLYRDTALAMVTIWYRSETFTHGFIVLPIVLWLVWRRRAMLAAKSPRPNPWFLLVVSALALMWLLGDLVAVNSITQLALVAILVAAVPALLGLPVAVTIAFPLAFMFFAVPIGEFIMPLLMDWTADFTILALRMSGIPVFREGLNFVIPSGNWSVVEACSGVRYLIASLTVGTLYAYLNYQSMQRRLLFVLVSILVPVVANWLRAYMIVMLGHLSGNTIAVGVDHLVYGWVFFGIVILLMFMIGARWAEPEPALTGAAGASVDTRQDPASPTGFWGTAIVLAAIVAMPMIARQTMETQAAARAGALVLPELDFQPWVRQDPSTIGFKPHFDNPSGESNHLYVDGNRAVGLYLGYYRNQNYGRKLVTSTNMLVRSQDKSWSQLGQAGETVEVGGGAKSVRSAELRRLGAASAQAPEKLLAWQIYWIHGRLTSNDYLAKVYSAGYQLLGRGDDSAVLIVYTPMHAGKDARETLAAFLLSHYGRIDQALQSVADQGQ